MNFFSLASLALMLAAVLITAAAISVYVVLRLYRRRASRAGYDSLREYLRAAPRSDGEKRDAIDLALWGAAFCLLGLLFPPLLIVGVFPLYYGSRKVAYAALGLGLAEDLDDESD